MEYNVIEEARNANHNLEQNAWTNHKDEYIGTKTLVDDFNDRIDYQEILYNEAATQEEKDKAQDELTKIIDDILSVNENFNSSLITVNMPAAPANQEDLYTIDYESVFGEIE